MPLWQLERTHCLPRASSTQQTKSNMDRSEAKSNLEHSNGNILHYIREKTDQVNIYTVETCCQNVC